MVLEFAAFRTCRATSAASWNEAIRLLNATWDQFLTVLPHPHLPLRNNLSENDIREHAQLRKINAGTRSDLGRRCRDTFLRLKKTCRKLGVSFHAYLHDRLTGPPNIPLLGKLMQADTATRSTLAADTATDTN